MKTKKRENLLKDINLCNLLHTFVLVRLTIIDDNWNAPEIYIYLLFSESLSLSMNLIWHTSSSTTPHHQPREGTVSLFLLFLLIKKKFSFKVSSNQRLEYETLSAWPLFLSGCKSLTASHTDSVKFVFANFQKQLGGQPQTNPKLGRIN